MGIEKTEIVGIYTRRSREHDRVDLEKKHYNCGVDVFMCPAEKDCYYRKWSELYVYSGRMQLTKRNINDDICRQMVKSSWGLVTPGPHCLMQLLLPRHLG